MGTALTLGCVTGYLIRAGCISGLSDSGRRNKYISFGAYRDSTDNGRREQKNWLIPLRLAFNHEQLFAKLAKGGILIHEKIEEERTYF